MFDYWQFKEKKRFAFWIDVICANVIVNLLTIFSFIARLLWSCGIWCLVYLEFIGLCLCLLLGFLLAGKVDLWAFCLLGFLLFGHHRNGDLWRVVPQCLLWCIWKERNSRCFEDFERSIPDIKLLFFRTLLDWFSVWRNHHFSSILDFLDFWNVCFWFVPPCIPPMYLGVSLFFYQWNFITYQKKKKWLVDYAK